MTNKQTICCRDSPALCIKRKLQQNWQLVVGIRRISASRENFSRTDSCESVSLDELMMCWKPPSLEPRNNIAHSNLSWNYQRRWEYFSDFLFQTRKIFDLRLNKYKLPFSVTHWCEGNLQSQQQTTFLTQASLIFLKTVGWRKNKGKSARDFNLKVSTTSFSETLLGCLTRPSSLIYTSSVARLQSQGKHVTWVFIKSALKPPSVQRGLTVAPNTRSTELLLEEVQVVARLQTSVKFNVAWLLHQIRDPQNFHWKKCKLLPGLKTQSRYTRHLRVF